ncbi:hypothetical protein MLP_20270 [Microlunatus phosphovorus NM-1]|uniref:Uncharacterized protein n=1 Tax=Microlunatus phosphovorus (strain ATCC 700054 / DSM 10555 / JCM 9379 / NBRC 101784 / NCIMB 13414 / VKM Ac-1990 / NM-1) TaxID=1032480 RepID=F5XDL8_MICPN|nr:hypothetical protein MLP_20270 [Microlunatus phosphovorus NM-1]
MAGPNPRLRHVVPAIPPSSPFVGVSLSPGASTFVKARLRHGRSAVIILTG